MLHQVACTLQVHCCTNDFQLVLNVHIIYVLHLYTRVWLIRIKGEDLINISLCKMAYFSFITAYWYSILVYHTYTRWLWVLMCVFKKEGYTVSISCYKECLYELSCCFKVYIYTWHCETCLIIKGFSISGDKSW